MQVPNDNSQFRAALLAALLSFGLTACGGGGGGGTDPTPTPTPQNHAPVANAGPEQTVNENVVVILDATASTDADSDSLSYTWLQTSGPNATLAEHTEGWAKATFTAPSVPGGTSLTFELSVSDGEETATDTVTVTVKDITAPGGTFSNTGALLGKTEAIVVTFDEAIDPASLSLNGTLATEADIAWSNGNRTLTLTPNTADDEWVSGSGRSLSIDAKDTVGNALVTLAAEWLVKLVFENFQAAETVIGQTDFVTSTVNTGGRSAATLGRADGSPAYLDGWLYISDTYTNIRVLGFDGIPSANGASASLVLGQANFTLADIGPVDASHFLQPFGMSTANGKLLLADADRNRVLIFDPAPTASGAAATLVLGQADFGADGNDCASDRMSYPTEVVLANGKLLVTDTDNHRVLIWNEVPTTNGQPADLVLGQQDFTHCAENDQDGDGATDGPAANTFKYPWGAWSDGERLAIIDNDNNRVLIWNSFPTSNGQPADIVLGQNTFANNQENDDNQDGAIDAAPTARTLRNPYDGITFNGEQLFVTDNGNSRVLMWDSFPTANFQPADLVLGQSVMTLKAPNDTDQDGVEDAPDARVFSFPRGLLLAEDKLIVNDGNNARVLVFRSQ